MVSMVAGAPEQAACRHGSAGIQRVFGATGCPERYWSVLNPADALRIVTSAQRVATLPM